VLAQGQEDLEIDSTLWNIDLDDVVVTAQFSPTHYKSVLERVQVLDQEQLKQRGATTVQEALAILPSIRFSQDAILGTQISLNGLDGNNVALLIDGIPQIGRLNGNIDLSQFSLSQLDRIEIIEGPQSSLYGNNAAGGVINLITKTPEYNSITGNIEIQGRSTSEQIVQAGLGFSAGPLSISGHGRYFIFDQYAIDSLRIRDEVVLNDSTTSIQRRYPWNPKEQYNYGANLGLNITENQNLRFTADRWWEELKNIDQARRLRFNPYGNDGRFITIRDQFALFYKNYISDNGYLEFTASINNFERQTISERYLIDSMRIDTAFTQIDTNTFDAVFTKIQYSHTFQNLKVLLGGQYNSEIGRGDRIKDPSRQDSLSARFTEWAGFTKLQYDVGRFLSIGASARYVVHNKYGGNFTPAFHLKLLPDRQSSIRFQLARGFRSPTLKELYMEFIDINHFIIGNQGLLPETSDYVELSYSRAFNISKDLLFRSNIRGFYTSVRNRIGLSQFEEGRFQYFNDEQFRNIGLNAEFTIRSKQLQFTSNILRSYWSSGLDNSIENAPAYRSSLDIQNTLTYTVIPEFTMSVNYRYVGSEPQYFLNAGEVQVSTVDNFHLLDISVNHTIQDNLTITLGANNITNTQRVGVSGGLSGAVHSATGSQLVGIGTAFFSTLAFSF